MPTGPRGEKRPASPVSSMMKAMRVATGIEPEEYVDDEEEKDEEPDEGTDEDGYEYEEAALEMTDSTPPKGSSKRAKKRRKKLTK